MNRLEVGSGMRLWNLSSAFAAANQAIVGGQFATGFALSLGASNVLVGLLAAAPMWGQALQLFSPLFIERLKRRKPLCLIAYTLAFTTWLGIALIPWVFVAPIRPWAMIILVVVSGSYIALASPATNSWLTDLVPADVRGRWMGRQQSVVLLVTLFVSLIAGKYLERFAEDGRLVGFVTLFVGAVVCGWLSIWVWAYVPEPPKHESEQGTLFNFITLPFRHVSFRNFTLFVALRGLAVMIAAPFFVVYMLKVLKIPWGQIAAFNAIAQVTSMVANPLWGYLADKFGFKPILRISSTALAVVPLPWMFATEDNYWYIVPFVQAWAGVMSAGVVIAQFSLMMKTAPAENRSIYIGFYSAAVNVAMAIGAQLGGMFADLFSHVNLPVVFGHAVMNFHCIFLLSSLGRLTGLRFLKRVREEQEVSTSVVIEQVRSGNPLVTFWNLMLMTRTEDAAIKVQASKALGGTRSLLAVDELIHLLDDSDRTVRSEAARALGVIGDERAVEPLIAKLRDPLADIVEDAATALGHLPTKASLVALVNALDQAEASVRKSIVLALGAMGDPRALPTLRALIEVELDPAVLMAATEALSRIGDRRALPRLRKLLRASEPGVGRKQLANSIGNVLGVPGGFYKLLQADPMRQDELVARSFHASRRRLGGRRMGTSEDREFVEVNLDAGLQRFMSRQHGAALICLRHVAVRATTNFVTGLLGDALLRQATEGYPTLPPKKKLAALLHRNERLRSNFGFLYGVHAESCHRKVHPEEALLAAFAFDQIVDELVELARRATRLNGR